LVTICVVNALIKGEIEDWSSRGPVDGRPWCNEWFTMWCGLTLGLALHVRVAAWFALVQVKSGHEKRSYPCRASEEWRDKEARLDGPGGRAGSSAGPMVARKARRSRGQETM
jgi:hypothetical protein